ncbi:MAG TPA: VOC family protein [Polyangia bacterium]|nr:VOC family protein [Polyangia bacterium]
MIDHVSLGVRDLARAERFYDAALAPLGYVRLWQSEKWAGYGMPGAADEKLALFAEPGAAAAGPGAHLAFTAPAPGAVDAFHRAALACGGADEGAPGPRPRYGAGYYAAFVRDPDGHKLEAVHHGRADQNS